MMTGSRYDRWREEEADRWQELLNLTDTWRRVRYRLLYGQTDSIDATDEGKRLIATYAPDSKAIR